MLMDLHCHLDLYPDPQQVVSEVIKRQIYVLSVTTTPSAWEITNSLASGSRLIRTAIGLHPQLVAQRQHEIELFDQHLARTRYVGEIGLDGTDEFRPHHELQKEVFRNILRLCGKAGGKILSIHSRAAAEDVISCLKRCPEAGVPIFHWFSGNETELKAAIQLDAWFSVGSAMLRSKRASALIAKIPRNRILTETDGPFTRLGNRPQLPWDVEQALAGLASIWNRSVAETCRQLGDNLKALTRAI